VRGLIEVMKVCSITDLRTDSQNWDFSEQKSGMTNSCWHFGMCFVVHSSAQLSVNNRKEQFTSSSFINVILYVEIKKTVGLPS
jgi:hypothetical protein